GTYIFKALLADPTQKIKGKLVRTVERKYYKEELRQIIRSQIKFHPELNDATLYEQCITALYPSNHSYRNSIKAKGFEYLIVDDIIFYQRPLKSKKSLIDNCPYETHVGQDKETGTPKEYGVKCIAKSNPLYQEFRLWQFLSNIKIFRKDTDDEVTGDFLRFESDKVYLFNYLNDRKEISQKTFLQYPGFNLKKTEQSHYRWNYVEEKEYPCNETRHSLLAAFKKAGLDASLLDAAMEMKLWHLLYSISDKGELEKALQGFATKSGFDNVDDFVEAFKKFPPFKNEYGAYSEKAIRKLLALMRMGDYWDETAIDSRTKERIQHLIDGEVDPTISMRVREKAIELRTIEDFKGLPLWLACYVVYGRHSEAKDLTRWTSPDDIDTYLKAFKQHSLHNPIVEQVVLETLRTVRDIWKRFGHIDEIHVELGREMKNPADKRRQITEKVLKNEDTNLRIRALLREFMDPSYEIDNVRPNSPSQQELLRIYEDGAMSRTSDIPDDINDILKKFRENDAAKRPSKSDVMRYKLWLEQRYQSPYTGQMIPLGKLFTPAYEIEHVVPQSLYFDDSLTNKVICESEVNKLKSNQLGLEFIKNHGGEIVTIGTRQVKILTEEQYRKFVTDHYADNKPKAKRLLLEELPDDFILRQLNDSRYISKLIRTLLSNIVREEEEQEGVSKHVISCVGQITDRLKKDWGINDVWNTIILPRFRRLNEVTDSSDFTCVNANGHEVPCMPMELQRGFNKKRIDHRHHAMDAIVIACASRSIVNYLNNASAASNAKETRYDLQRLLCSKRKTDENGNYTWIVDKPWDT
ncbi:MAG: type II CRISPR RNA-guided endonuclease Cas9, partial [Bacteroidaceae bacterium]|nr:type II CRISPR RNA-guided endonuclease Cas9 [Bacteroidaceae bacterium]